MQYDDVGIYRRIRSKYDTWFVSLASIEAKGRIALYHLNRHGKTTMHKQGNFNNFEECLAYIKRHDKYREGTL